MPGHHALYVVRMLIAMTPTLRQGTNKGRLDKAIHAFASLLCEKLEAKTGVDLYQSGQEGGFYELTEIFIDHWGIPRRPINVPLMLAQNAGLLPKRRRNRRAA